MQDLHRRFLGADSTTDVLSFPLEDPGDGALEGEVVVNAQQAVRVAQSLGCEAQAELLLYVVHGVLHLCGYDDRSEQDAAAMRSERFVAYLSLAAESVSSDERQTDVREDRRDRES